MIALCIVLQKQQKLSHHHVNSAWNPQKIYNFLCKPAYEASEAASKSEGRSIFSAEYIVIMTVMAMAMGALVADYFYKFREHGQK